MKVIFITLKFFDVVFFRLECCFDLNFYKLLRKSVGFMIAAAEIYYAFRGWLVSPLVLSHSGVSPRPFLPQESSYISSAD